ncbi:MAG: tRNA (N6-threonylcarbamoyladenosine(37)-N6)-methyltransferase TrmO [Desulfobacterium sp.]|jgi:tRNA-Thr(GGU) m(6)t(6)A37 methyltransferase TsaA|nr:tRNA (N6-threonylcarbamoyladenosine(37)-N6)-methyltransferase TrmO [Desulfobacterium sp.]
MITFNEIGIIHSPHREPKGAPIQPAGAAEFKGRVEVFPQFQEGLADLDGFERIILIYHFHLSNGFDLMVKPFLDDQKRGLFSTRAPKRPNPLGLSIVRLLGVENNILHIQGVDIVDKTPLIDIKPYVPQFDSFPDSRAGWIDAAHLSARSVRADNRFK